METIEKMINIIAWTTVFAAPLFITLALLIQHKYNRSYERLIDLSRGFNRNFTSGIPKLLMAFLLALVFLVAKCT